MYEIMRFNLITYLTFKSKDEATDSPRWCIHTRKGTPFNNF